MCGDRHQITDECNNFSNTANLFSLHCLRKQKIGHINKKKATDKKPNFFKVLMLTRLDTDFRTSIIDKVPACLEKF